MEPFEGKMTEASDSKTICTKLERIAKLAKQIRDKPLSTLAHHMDLVWMREAYRRTRKDGASGVDGQTAEQYEQNLDENLSALLERAKSGTYRAPPVRRVHIPKASGNATRPIGIPTFEDKVLQRAVAMILEAVYEQDFLDCSYGFRKGRSAFGAIDKLQVELMRMRGGWVVEVDIQAFFDSVARDLLMEMIRQRVVDGVVLRLIAKWLRAGVMENGEISYPDAGTPQGGVISPILANIFLHEVVDVWFAKEVRPRMKGRATMIRYADDIAMAFELEEDARRVMDVLPKRFGKYKLTLHPQKTRLVDFRRPPRPTKHVEKKQSQAGSFDVLGFTVYWGLTRKGYWVVKLKTAKHAAMAAGRPAAVIGFPPTYKGGYERLYRFLNENIEWPQPSYAVWDPSDLPEWLRTLQSAGIPFCVGTDHLVEGFEPVAAHIGASRKAIYLYADGGGSSLVREANRTRPFRYEPVEAAALTADTEVLLVPVGAQEMSFLKDRYLAKGIAHTSGHINMLVYVGGRLAGGFIYTRSSHDPAHSLYLLSDFAIVRERRIAKLIALVATSALPVSLAERRLLIRVESIVTTAFTKKPVSMKYRGAFKLTKRGEGFLQYSSEVRRLSPQEIYRDWFRKHASRNEDCQGQAA